MSPADDDCMILLFFFFSCFAHFYNGRLRHGGGEDGEHPIKGRDGRMSLAARVLKKKKKSRSFSRSHDGEKKKKSWERAREKGEASFLLHAKKGVVSCGLFVCGRYGWLPSKFSTDATSTSLLLSMITITYCYPRTSGIHLRYLTEYLVYTDIQTYMH